MGTLYPPVLFQAWLPMSLALCISALGAAFCSAEAAEQTAVPPPSIAPNTAPAITNPAPTAKDWADIAKLPDWSGIWHPDTKYLAAHSKTDLPSWTTEATQQIAELKAEDEAGHPKNIYINCLPEGMPSFVLMTLNSLEFLFTPGRITILSEFDGNRMRRIYTDGRPHPTDPDLTFNGHSIGHWEGAVLVVDTVAVLPETFIPIGQSVALPNNGDMHIVERISLAGPDKLQDEIEINAPHVLATPWKTTRLFTRSRQRKFDIIEASCLQGNFVETHDKNGNAIFEPVPHDEDGAPFASNK